VENVFFAITGVAALMIAIISSSICALLTWRMHARYHLPSRASLAPDASMQVDPDERVLRAQQQLRLKSRWQTVLASFQTAMVTATTTGHVTDAFTRAIQHEFDDAHVLIGIGPILEIILQHAKAHGTSTVALDGDTQISAFPAIAAEQARDLVQALYRVIASPKCAQKKHELLYEVAPTLSQRMAQRLHFDGKSLLLPLRYAGVTYGVVLLSGEELLQRDATPDTGDFLELLGQMVTTWVRCMTPQVLTGGSQLPPVLSVGVLNSLQTLEHPLSLESQMASHDMLQELAGYARFSAERVAELSLLARQSCLSLRRICQADLALILLPASAGEGGSFAVEAIEMGDWSWSRFQAQQQPSFAHPLLKSERELASWPDGFVQVARDGQVIHAATSAQARASAARLAQSGAQALLVVPAMLDGCCQAILVAGYLAEKAFSAPMQAIAESMATIIATNLRLMQVLHESHYLHEVVTEVGKQDSSMSLQFIEGLSDIAKTRSILLGTDPHRMAEVAEHLALALGLSALEVAQIRIAALVCDIGMVSVPESIPRKRGPLTPNERKCLHMHPQISVKILGEMPLFVPVLPLVLHHHERWDGGG
jgi:hypothetical protein